MNLKNYKKHIFVCTGSKCAPEISPDIYQKLKQKLEEKSLSKVEGGVMRSQSSCLGVCQGGPLLVVYPEAVWYDQVSEEDLDRIIDEHLVQDKPVKDLIFHKNQYSCKKPSD